MEKVVKELIKVDFHIHSFRSSNKDGDKVSFNTISNIPVLVEKLKGFLLGLVLNYIIS